MRGFTIIEMLIVIVVVLTVGAVIITGHKMKDTPTNDVTSRGYYGIVETRCINGYQFVLSYRDIRQVMDECGHGVKCQ